MLLKIIKAFFRVYTNRQRRSGIIYPKPAMVLSRNPSMGTIRGNGHNLRLTQRPLLIARRRDRQ